jgi:hypothetical protein
MGRLQNLHTLNIMKTPVQELPIEIFRLYKLRHLLAHYHDLEIESSLYAMQGVKVMSHKYCIFGPLNLHYLNLELCYFLIFLVSLGVKVFCR